MKNYIAFTCPFPQGPDDFSGKAEIVVFSSGNTTTLGVSVSVADDTRAEDIERFFVALIPATEGGVTLSAGRDRATVEIIDNDCKRTHSPATHTLLHPRA